MGNIKPGIQHAVHVVDGVIRKTVDGFSRQNAASLYHACNAAGLQRIRQLLHPAGGNVDKLSLGRRKPFCQCSGKLGGVVLQGGNSAVQRLALGLHSAKIPPALFRCRQKRIGQQVIADLHFLHIFGGLPGIIGKDAVHVNAGIGELLDIGAGRLACVFDLLQVLRHAA